MPPIVNKNIEKIKRKLNEVLKRLTLDLKIHLISIIS